MRVQLPTRRPPDLLEQILGRRRARNLRRRLGLLAVGAGFTLLKPRTRWLPAALVVTSFALVAVLVRNSTGV
jgi:hypothetical protein